LWPPLEGPWASLREEARDRFMGIVAASRSSRPGPSFPGGLGTGGENKS